MKSKRLLSAGPLVLLLLLAACGGAGSGDDGGSSGSSKRLYINKAQPSSGDPTRGGVLKVAIEGPVRSMDPTYSQTSRIDWATTNLLYDPLVIQTANGGMQPVLATEWSASPDFTKWTYKLRPNVKFHDGTPFNAKAVAAHYNRLLTMGTIYRSYAELCGMKHASAVGDLSVIFQLSAPCAAFPTYMAVRSDYIESPTAVAKYGAEFGQHPVGTGPFMLADPDQAADYKNVKLVKNPNYWQQGSDGKNLPYLDGVEIRPLTDNTARFQSLQSGTNQLIQTTDADSVESAVRSDNLVVQQTYANQSQVLYMNMAAEPFDSLELRQAVAHAVDRNQISSIAFKGLTPTANSYLRPGTEYFVDKAAYPEMDVEKAKELVNKAKATGASTRVEFIVNTSVSSSMTALIQQQLKAVGLEVNVRTVDLPTSLDIVFAQKKFQIAIGPSVSAIDPAQLIQMFGSQSPQNVSGFKSAKVDQLFSEGLRTGLDEPRRKEIYRDIQLQVVEQVPSIPIVRTPAAVIASDRVHGLPDPIQQADQALLLTTVYLK